jgi:hypothetical protein
MPALRLLARNVLLAAVDTYFCASRKVAFYRISPRERPLRQGVGFPHQALSSSTVPAKRLRSHGPIPGTGTTPDPT